MAWFLSIFKVMVAFYLPFVCLRFFWWRMNTWGEVTSFVGSLPLGYPFWPALGPVHKPFWEGFLLPFAKGRIVILVTALPTPPEKEDVLTNFCQGRKPPGFWGRITSSLPLKIVFN